MNLPAVAALFLTGALFAPPKIAIVIYHADAVPAAELGRAEAVAGAILRQAGIEVVWRPAIAGDIAPQPYEIPVHLLALHPSNLARETSGYAMLMGNNSYAGISWPAVQTSAAALEADEATLMGAVMAHELGHILLKSRDHATNGVMIQKIGRAELRAAARGELQFLRSQAQRIRAEAARRRAASKNVIEDLHDAQARSSRPFDDRLSPSSK
jgi:hypothetical protein